MLNVEEEKDSESDRFHPHHLRIASPSEDEEDKQEPSEYDEEEPEDDPMEHLSASQVF